MQLFELFGKIVIENSGANAAIDSTVGKAAGLAKSLGSGVASAAQTVGKAAGKVAVTAGKAVAGAVTSTATAIGTITKKSVEAYADYEQLVGGVETLFKDTADEVIGYADEAYKTAGLSANDYMETVTSFAASLNQSLISLEGNTASAADRANQAIIDMSDNANKMGTDMSMIQNAYQGFAKQNYSMLDNLKLGYGGTQQEMYRLLSDAKELDKTFDAEFSLSSKGTLSAEFADILEAIHIVQNNMGITGTTAKEAGSTISGSLASAKAAWENLLVGFADPEQDMGVLTENFVGSVTTAAENLIPRISEMIPGIVEGIKEMAPLVSQAFDEHLVPMISEGLSGAFSLIGIEINPETITGVFATVKEKAVGLLSGIKETISDNKEELTDMVSAFGGLGSELGRLVGQVNWDAVFEGLVKAVTWVTGAVSSGIGALNDYISRVKELASEIGVVNGMLKALAEETAHSNIPTLADLGVEETVNLNDIANEYIKNNMPFASENANARAAQAAKEAARAQAIADTAAAYGSATEARTSQAVADARAEAAAKAAAEAAAAQYKANTSNTKKNAKGAILNRATIFGKVGETYQIGGEAGAEAVAPIEKLQGYVSTAVAEVMAGQNAATAEVFAASAGAIVDKLETLADDIAAAIGGRIGINKREFGRLVREV